MLIQLLHGAYGPAVSHVRQQVSFSVTKQMRVICANGEREALRHAWKGCRPVGTESIGGARAAGAGATPL